MKIKNIFLRLASLLAAFVFGISVLGVGQYFESVFQAKEQSVLRTETDAAQIENPIFPRRNVGEIKPFGSERPITNFEPEVKREPEPVEETEYEFDAAGDYFIIGDLPKGFKDFDIFSLTTKNYENATEENDYEGVPIPPEGYVSTNKKFEFVKIKVAVKQIAFETEAKKGISYRFVGEFIDSEEIPIKPAEGYEYTAYAVLKGRLVKMRDGKKIAESEVKFGIYAGC